MTLRDELIEGMARAMAERAGRSYAIGKDVFDRASTAALDYLLGRLSQPSDEMIDAAVGAPIQFSDDIGAAAQQTIDAMYAIHIWQAMLSKLSGDGKVE